MNNKPAVIDGFRLAAEVSVVASHCAPLAGISADADFILGHVVGRIAVPFFFMVSGYFIAPRLQQGWGKLKSFCARLALIYALAILLYLPLNIYAGHWTGETPLQIAADVLWNGTFYHLWYLPAAITGMAIAYTLTRKLGIRAALAISGLLYVLALGGDSYYGLVARIPAIASGYEAFFTVFDFTRNGFLMAPIFITLGFYLAGKPKPQLKPNLAALLLVLALMVGEALLLRSLGWQRFDRMYLLLPLCMVVLFRTLLAANGRGDAGMRRLSLLVYIIHPWVIVLVRGFAGWCGWDAWLVDNNLLHFIAVCLASFAGSWILLKVWDKLRARIKK